jgi:RimJ/RimL family protein N-acetyltransferase
VADEWQGQGIATALLAELMRQRPVGVTQLATTVAADNVASLRMLQRLGECTVTDAGTGRLDVVVDLPPRAEPGSDEPGQGGAPEAHATR